MRTNFFELEYICPPNRTAVLKVFYIIFPSRHSHPSSVPVPERRGQLIVYPSCLSSHLAIIGDTGPRAPYVIVEVRHLSRRVCLSRSYVFEIPLLTMGRGGPCRCCCYGLDILYLLVEGIYFHGPRAGMVATHAHHITDGSQLAQSALGWLSIVQISSCVRFAATFESLPGGCVRGVICFRFTALL